jgi:GDP-L-fucose synthase
VNKDSRIYVAGHTGLVGSALLLKLQEQGYTNIITAKHGETYINSWSEIDKFDLTLQDHVDDFFYTHFPEYVFLCAAKVGGISANNNYPADFIRENLQIQTNVIEAAHIYGAKKLLFLGSSCIYPRSCPQPMKESYLLSNTLEPTNEAYAIAKIAGIKMCQAYNKQYGTNFISVMPTNIYGPRDNFDIQNGHVIGALIAKFAEAKKEGKPVTILGNGSAKREFLYSEDLAEALIFLMNNYNSSEIINIGCNEYVYIEELVWLLCELFKYDNIIWDDFSPNGTPEKKLDTSRLEKLGWKYKIPLRKGLKKTIRWYYETNTVNYFSNNID